MGCFWITNPVIPSDVPGLDPSKTVHCADCNPLDCADLGGIWMPLPCNFFSNRRGAGKAYEIVPCPDPFDDSYGQPMGWCCVNTGNPNEDCFAFGPHTGFDSWQWCVAGYGGNGTWIDMDDWPGGSGISPQAWASQQCEKICSKIVIIEEANRGFEPSIPKEEVDKLAVSGMGIPLGFPSDSK